MNPMLEVALADASAVAEARRRVAALAAALAFDEVRAGQLALVVTELATNVLKHGGGRGWLLAGDDGQAAIDVLALDQGPGMTDIARCLADGYSSTGTPGNGLGAVRRLAHSFHVASWPGQGTVLHARLLRQGAKPPSLDDAVAGVCVAKPGEVACGDGWAWHGDAGTRTVFVVDGLGHGTEAAVAAQAALERFRRQPDDPPELLIEGVHRALTHTRGAAAAAARIDAAARTVRFAGLGNIAAAVMDAAGGVRRLVSLPGIAGHNARRVQAFDQPFVPGGGRLVMHSDGIGSHWSLQAQPGLLRAHPALLAGWLWRDHARRRDDATAVAACLEVMPQDATGGVA